MDYDYDTNRSRLVATCKHSFVVRVAGVEIVSQRNRGVHHVEVSFPQNVQDYETLWEPRHGNKGVDVKLTDEE